MKGNFELHPQSSWLIQLPQTSRWLFTAATHPPLSVLPGWGKPNQTGGEMAVMLKTLEPEVVGSEIQSWRGDVRHFPEIAAGFFIHLSWEMRGTSSPYCFWTPCLWTHNRLPHDSHIFPADLCLVFGPMKNQSRFKVSSISQLDVYTPSYDFQPSKLFELRTFFLFSDLS